MIQDLRYAIRNLRRNKGFTTVAVLALALGIGANTAIFTVVESVLLRPLPFPNSDRLYSVRPVPDKPSRFEFSTMFDPQYLELRNASSKFEPLAAYNGVAVNWTAPGDPERIRGAQVTANFFQLLGVQPALGRMFVEEETLAGRSNVAVISDRLWRARFNADRDALGRSVTLDGNIVYVIGVMPPGFAFPNRADLWMPAVLEPANFNITFRQVIGAVKPGESVEQAAREVDARQQAAAQRNKQFEGVTIRALPLQETIVGKSRQGMLVMLGAVGLVLLIACVNVANLLLAKASGRRQEIVVRASLGASRWRLIRQLMTESIVLGLIGGCAGLLLAIWGVEALTRIAPRQQLPRLEEIHLDRWVLAFNFAVSVVIGALFGVVPALHSTASRVSSGLKEASQRTSARVGAWKNGMVVAELALAVILLAGAGLLIRSFVKIRSIDLGFRPENVVAMGIDLDQRLYKTPDEIKQFSQSMLSQISTLPGVTSAGLVNWLPLGEALIVGSFQVQGQPPPENTWAAKPSVSPGYFSAMGIRLLDGRLFDDRDTKTSERVAVVDQTLARRFFGAGSALGQRITMQDKPRPEDWMTIIGVVESIKQENPRDKAGFTIYEPFQQTNRDFFLRPMTYVVRTGESPMSLAPALRAKLWGIDRNIPVRQMTSMERLLQGSIAEPRFQTQVLTAFSVIAFLLAVVGIYGVISYSVTQRTREIGIRMAIGAQRGNILSMILSRSGALILAGLGIGTAGALLATRSLKSFLYETEPSDPVAFITAGLTLGIVALLAAYLPARRAASTDPSSALRYE